MTLSAQVVSHRDSTSLFAKWREVASALLFRLTSSLATNGRPSRRFSTERALCGLGVFRDANAREFAVCGLLEFLPDRDSPSVRPRIRLAELERFPTGTGCMDRYSMRPEIRRNMYASDD